VYCGAIIEQPVLNTVTAEAIMMAVSRAIKSSSGMQVRCCPLPWRQRGASFFGSTPAQTLSFKHQRAIPYFWEATVLSGSRIESG
jgi:hypothetical protein